MTIKLTCGDGIVLRLPQEHFEKSIFNNREIAVARSYTLRCKARSEIVNAILDVADGESQKVTITEDNFEELQNLCKELGFRGLDKELRTFLDLKEFLQLKERVTRQDKRLAELERQLNESLERKVDEVARVCEERNVESSRKTEQALRECAKQRDLEGLAREVALLKESQSAVQVHPAKSLGVIETKRSGLPPLNKSLAAKPAPPKVRKRKELVYNSSKPLEGVIAYLTRECGGNVHDKGIVYVMGAGHDHRQVVEFGDKKCWWSSDAKAWICYDFVEQRVSPTSYSIRSDKYLRLKSWVIDVSNDGYSWTKIEHQDDNNDLDGEAVTAHFKISNVPDECFRLRQIGKNHTGSNGCRIAAMEIFGTLFVAEKVEKTQPSRQEFVYQADREGQFPPPLFTPKLDGIIAHWTRECSGNVHDKGIVNVTASSGYQPKNVADLGADSIYESKDEQDTWICYDFKKRRVIPTSYSVRSFGQPPEGEHLKSWVIEVSNDGSLWTEIDRQDNNRDLNDNHVTANFKITNVPRESFRFFRLRQTGENHYRRDTHYVVGLTALEVFGTLFEK